MTNQQFIKEHLHLSPAKVALLLSKKPELNKDFIISQINGKQKAKIKLPEFYKNEHIVYPSPLSMEQCSSEITALYKSKFLKGKNLVDLTGGFGVDSYYFSKQFKTLTYLEPHEALFNVVTQNFKKLHAHNIDPINTSTEEFLATNQEKFNVAYIDPSRRNEKQRVYLLNDCTPNIIELTSSIFKIADKILIKTAPLLDIKQSLKELK